MGQPERAPSSKARVLSFDGLEYKTVTAPLSPRWKKFNEKLRRHRAECREEQERLEARERRRIEKEIAARLKPRRRLKMHPRAIAARHQAKVRREARAFLLDLKSSLQSVE